MSARRPPSATVVVPARNAEAVIGECVGSLLALDYEGGFELIVVDDCSTDSTATLARDAGARCIVRSSPGGAGAARNTGILAACGEVVAFTDSDCLAEPDWLARLVEPLAEEGVAIAAGDILALPGRGAIERYGEVIHDNRAAVEVYSPPYAVSANWASPRRALLDLGMFDETFRRGQDVDLSYRAVAAGYRIVHAPGAVVRHRNRSTLRGLARQGYTHGFHGRRIERRHRALLDSYGHGRLRAPSLATIGGHLRDAAAGDPGGLAAATFKLGKRAGMAAGGIARALGGPGATAPGADRGAATEQPRVVHASLVHRPLDARIQRRQCPTLVDTGYDVHLLAGGLGPENRDGVRLHSISENGDRPPLRRQPVRFARLARRALALRADLYHLHDPHLIPLGLLLQARGAMVIYDVHEDYPAHARQKLSGRPVRRRAKPALWRLLEALARRRFDGFVCASDALAERFPPQRTVVARNFPRIDEAPPQAVGERADAAVALWLGTIRADRVRACLGAFEHVPKESGLRLRLVGDVNPRAFADEIRALPWADRIDLEEVTALSRERVLEEVSGASIGMATLSAGPNHREGWRSNKLFQLMAAGVPVVVSDFPGWRSIVERYRCGLAAGPDPRELAEALVELAGDPDRAGELGRNGREAVARELNWETEAAGLLGLYDSLLGAPPAPLGRPDGAGRTREAPGEAVERTPA